MITAWRADFSDEMIFRAAETMNENIDKPDLRYMDKILKNWKKAGIRTPEDAKRENEHFERQKAQKEKSRRGEISRPPTYDLDQIRKDALKNTDIKILRSSYALQKLCLSESAEYFGNAGAAMRNRICSGARKKPCKKFLNLRRFSRNLPERGFPFPPCCSGEKIQRARSKN